MRKVIFKGLIIALLVLASGVAGCTQKTPTQSRETNVITTTPSANLLIPLALPLTAKVIIKQGQQKSGHLTAINSQQITLFSGKDSSIPIATIDKVVFEGEVVLRSGGTIVIRGEKNEASSESNQKTWTESLNNFILHDPSKGQAELKLTSVDTGELMGIQAVAQNSTWVVEEMRFESPEKIKIQVRPHRK
jgi:hypothetical protein